MSAFLCLDPNYNDVCTAQAKDWQYLTHVIKRLEHTQELAAKLATAGWRTEVEFDEGHIVSCHPPKTAETEADIKKLLDASGVDVEDYGYVDYDDEFDPEDMCDGDVSIDDCDGCCGGCDDDDIEPLMNKHIAEAIIGRIINAVDIVDDYRVVLHLGGGDGSKLIFDEQSDGVFTLE